MQTVVAILGSYRREGITDQAVEAILASAGAEGASTNKIHLLDYPIEFCRNCRVCTQAEGSLRGRCPQNDSLAQILDQVDSADAIVFASAINFFNVTALMRRFLERLVAYAYWPWGTPAPRERITVKSKKAIIVLSSAAPGILTRYFTGAPKALKAAASLVGARTVGTLYCGRAALEPDQELSREILRKAHLLGRKIS